MKLDRLILKNRYYILAVIIVLNFVAKGIFISSTSIAGDEPFSIYHAQMDIKHIIKLLSTGNNPPLYEILLHFWIKLFGISELSVRMPSLIFSTITVFYVFRIGFKYFNLRIGIVASLLFIFSNYQTLYAHEARVYAMFGMLATISMFHFLSLIDKHEKHWLHLSILILTNIVLIYSHYFGFFVLGIEFAFISISRELRRNLWKQLLASTLLIFIAYIPNIKIITERFLDSSQNGTWLTKPNGLASLYNMIVKFSNAPVIAVTIITILLISLGIYLLKRKNSKIPKAKLLIVIWFVTPFILMFCISYFIPMYLDRYLIFISAPFVILVPIAIESLTNNKKILTFLLFVICLLFVVTTKPNITNKRSVKETVQKIKEIKNDSTMVVINPYHFVLNFAYYYDLEIFKNIKQNDTYSSIEKELVAQNIFATYNILDLKYSKYNHIIFLDASANLSNPQNSMVNELLKEYTIVNTYKFYEVFMVYELRKIT